MEQVQETQEAYADYSNASSRDDEYAGAIREEKVVTLLTEIDPDKSLENIEMRLRGKVFNKQQGEWVDKYESVPNKLIERIMSLLSSVLNLNTTFSNLQPSDINRIMNLLTGIVISDLTVNGHEYGIHDNFIEKERIGFIVFNTTYLTLRRCINGLEARRFFSSLRMTETIMPQKQQRGVKNMFGVLSGRGY
jgi:hypothetical protein